MYFLTDLEHKYLIHGLLKAAREAGVSPELRGWSWHSEPLRPYYEDVKLPMYAIASKYCPTGRDVYMAFAEGERAKPNRRMALGKLLHGAVSDALSSFIERRPLSFEEWSKRIRWEEIPIEPEQGLRAARLIWGAVRKLCEARYEEASMKQPYASEADLRASAVPFLVEHKISGELLGLSGLLSIDCYDYLRSIIFDLKVGDEPREWHRLAPVGYALVFESVHEVPIDICCVVHLSISNDRLFSKKDLFFASDEYRRWWVEERDAKLEMVAERKDPGMPPECDPSCPFHHACHG